ncbi:PDZ domain-containing protein 8 isoform X2 [Cimex lectularius]|uniref:PDZ domain-containing protein 8 n=1 Tax=Cimex lectularius TaxID=79782 RepID=A0A8I6TCT3_CIMLE|nr:PDZ domain-containing protein 8 isoform X2 [Cimex lectularius]
MFGTLVFFALVALSFASGVFITLLIQWYFFNVYINKKPFVGPATSPSISPFELPKILHNKGNLGKEAAGAVNSLLQFLFQECRNTKRVRKWFRRRLSLELEVLLTRTTTGKLFENIVLRDLDLGCHLPAIRSIEVKNLSIDSGTKLIEEVELCLDLEYLGGFQLSIDASMRLSKLAHVSVKVNELSGLAQLKFTRHPYTHWSFSFYNDPILQLAVESQFQGRSLPQINSIIASQIRKALKRVHTLPNFNIRYKPFFVKTELELLEENDVLEPPLGTMELTILEITRLTEVEGPIYCNVAIDNIAWIEMTQTGTASYLTVDASVTKQSGQLGVNFKQEFVSDKYQVCIIVESISNPLITDLKSGDVLMLVDGKSVQTLSALNKIIKQAPSKLLFRVERKIRNLVSPDLKINEGLDCSYGLRNRVGSGDKTDSDSSNPPSSSDSPAKRSSCGSPEHNKSLPHLSVCSEPDVEFNHLQFFTTKDAAFSKVITFNETFKFNVSPEHRYLNVSVWTRGVDKNTLLGHISLPVANCCPSTVGHYISTYSFLPPNPNLGYNSPLSTHPGFEPCLCYGDVLLSFSFASSVNQSLPIISNVNKTPPPVTITTPINEETAQVIQHNFKRTHFEKVTPCGFCFKKIWLKDALQCQECLMSCHKKCAVKAQAGPSCARSIVRRTSIQPEIIMTSPEENITQTSLVEEGLFSISAANGAEIDQALEYLLSLPNDENIMSMAKESGKTLYSHLPPDMRKSRIDDMISKLKEAIDSESLKRQALQREEVSAEDAATKAKVAFLVGKSEERLHALAVLMLHCCAGLQDHQDALN